MQDPSYSPALPTASTKGCVYLAVCIPTGKAYIGKTVLGLPCRRKNHWADSKRSKTLFGNALRKYGMAQFSWEVLYISPSDEALLAAEVEILARYRAAGASLYNMTVGGDGAAGAAVSLETRQLHSLRANRMWQDPVLRSRLTKVLVDRSQDPAARALLSARATEYWQDPSARALQSARSSDRYRNPSERAKNSVSATAQWADPAARQKQSEAHKRLWADPVRRAAVLSKRHHQAGVRRALKLGLRYCKYRKPAHYHPLQGKTEDT